MCGFQIPGLCRSFAWDTNGTRSSAFFVGIIFIVETFSFKLGMSLELSLLHVCFYWKIVLFCKRSM